MANLGGELVDTAPYFADASHNVFRAGELIGPVQATTYYKMRGMDKNTSGLYDTWKVTGLPDFSATQYEGGLTTPLRDVVISASWLA